MNVQVNDLHEQVRIVSQKQAVERAKTRAKDLIHRPANGRPSDALRALEKKLFGVEALQTCVDVLLEIVKNKDQPGNVRVAAADSVINRICGKPRQSIDLNQTTDLVVTFQYGKKSLDSPQVVVDAEFREKPDATGDDR